MKTIVLLGALQGLIVGWLLRVSGRQRPEERVSRRLLAAIIFLIALACLDIYLIHETFWMDALLGRILGAVVPLVVVMPLGPLIYFYVRSCEEPDFRLNRRYRRHFYPVIVDLFQHITALVFIIALLARWIPPNKYNFGNFEDYYNQYADIPRWLSLTIYLVLASRYLRRRRHAADVEPDDVRRLSWLRMLLRVFWAFDLFWLVFLVPYELPKIGDELIDRFDWYPLYIPMVAIIYFLGAKGYFISSRSRRQVVPEKRAMALALPDEKLGEVMKVLVKTMEQDRVWLNADLNLSKLAECCGVAPKLLSAVLNQHMGTSFTDYVNGYRVDAVKERIIQPESRRLTIAGLAYECGFNSLPTFQRAFKTVTGMSPSEYMAGVLLNSGSE